MIGRWGTSAMDRMATKVPTPCGHDTPPELQDARVDVIHSREDAQESRLAGTGGTDEEQ